MTDNPKMWRRDQGLVNDTTDEIQEEVNQEHNPPKYSNPNRDRARGDWDRTRRRTDGDLGLPER
jgi:hypothetical protein